MNKQERMKVTRSSQMDARTSRNSVLDGVPNKSLPWIRDCRTRNMTVGRAGIEEDGEAIIIVIIIMGISRIMGEIRRRKEERKSQIEILCLSGG